MASDNHFISRENFREMIGQKSVVRTPSGHGGIVHEVLRVLMKNASTLEGIAERLSIERKTAYNAINHLKQRHRKRILRFYNPKDRKYYYYLESVK